MELTQPGAQGGRQPGSYREFPCRSCGAKLEFAPGTTSLRCPYCASDEAISAAPADGQGSAAQVEERCFSVALSRQRQLPPSELMPGGHEIECTGCGARTLLTGRADACPFCDSPVVVPREADGAALVPEAVLPFKIGAQQAGAEFGAWVRSRWFAPNDLAARAKHARMEGVYLPYYTYDTHTHSPYRGLRGTYYYVTETYTDAQGKMKIRQVRKTRWRPASGTVSLHFDDLLICASSSLPDKLIAELEPWDLERLRPYEPAYLSGFLAERAALGLEQGFELAKAKMVPAIESEIRREIGGDTQSISSYASHYSGTTFKLFLLPLWLSSFRYEEKVYRFVVNACTGEGVGERPYSAWKIALALLVALLAALATFWLARSSLG